MFDIGTSHSPMHIFRKWLELRRQVRQLNPDLVHGQYGTVVGFLTAFAGRPAVISFCGGDLLAGASVSRLRLYTGFLLSNVAALLAKKLICKSRGLREALWWRRDQTVVIPNGIDLELFSPGPRELARQNLGWDQESPVVLFNAGQEPERKGLGLAQQAMKVVLSQLPKAQLFVISDVQPDVMPVYYRAADALLSASSMEGSPNVVKEALACNLPVVSTPVGDVKERLAGVHPSAVVPRDAEAIAEALVQILRERKRSNGREHVIHLGQDQVAQHLLGVYRALLREEKESVKTG
jgi:glycosyltransferase involved in cell wall biosynthesis